MIESMFAGIASKPTATATPSRDAEVVPGRRRQRSERPRCRHPAQPTGSPSVSLEIEPCPGPRKKGFGARGRTCRWASEASRQKLEVPTFLKNSRARHFHLSPAEPVGAK
jgi:hypothetical protein